jgi:hypothetical protein
MSNGTRGVIAGGEPRASLTHDIEYITIATTGNSQGFGELTLERGATTSTDGDGRGLTCGGYNAGYKNIIDYVTIATTGNSTDFGDLITGAQNAAACSNNTRAVIQGGAQSKSTMDYVTIASTGNASDFGDMETATATSAPLSGD